MVKVLASKNLSNSSTWVPKNIEKDMLRGDIHERKAASALFKQAASLLPAFTWQLLLDYRRLPGGMCLADVISKLLLLIVWKVSTSQLESLEA